MIGLTPKQRRLYDFIVRRMAETGTAPTVREMAKECAVGLSGVYRVLNCLEQRGAIRRGRRAREIEIAQSSVTLNTEILTLTERYAAEHKISRDTAVNELLRIALGAAA